jgi:formylglycine-generating enzyme required for sulfatase activity
MKIHLSFLLILLNFAAFINAPKYKVDIIKHTAKEKKAMSKFKFIEGGTFTMGNGGVYPLNRPENDSTLLVTSHPKRQTVAPFFISHTEVTNEQWLEFYNDKKHELGENIARNKFYPDTSVWLKDYGHYEIYAKNYFQNDAFSKYPVVGVSWDQVISFCKWKTQKFNDLLIQHSTTDTIVFRLPTEAEWEYAAQQRVKKRKKRTDALEISPPHSFPWEYERTMCQINILTNIGEIYDDNGILLKSSTDDSHEITSTVASFPPNSQDLFDMGGNVSEWTSDSGFVEVFSKKAFSASDIQELIVHLEEGTFKDQVDQSITLDYTHFFESDRLKIEVIKSLKQDQEILKSNTKICKGGNWDDNLVYCLTSSRHIYKTSEASSKIGFRIAFSKPNKSLLKYFPQ